MNDIPHHLLIFGLGYTGMAVGTRARDAGFAVTATSRSPAAQCPPVGISVIDFAVAAPAIAKSSHVLVTAAPEADGDPVLAHHSRALRTAEALRWIGYLSTTGVYGDRGGGWVDEDTEPAPSGPRGQRRLQAEEAWRGVAAGRSLDLFRLAGIYGPGRSPLDDVRAGMARRVIKPGHRFGRIHRDDIARAVLAAMLQDRAPATRVLNLADDMPAETALVIEEAARLLDIPPPPAVPFVDAVQSIGPMARSFWMENRQVSSVKTQAELGLRWLYPSYREGLAAILAVERGEQLAQGAS
jgi:nucleoside-diphosphate-sugar epimerase